jgi:hypothetical protein
VAKKGGEKLFYQYDNLASVHIIITGILGALD